ncbi:MAG: putative toxin-antitoxin system toxin component, PIN family [Paludibacteraceae bacterium]|nr:putative toxin-antitoxin system toxin component, PIN family [Paludibacteraceae bacterium]MBP5523971.1 putative toxin-antitoxin system toxin component, PIN family [Paludibacteraceae bacterium]MEE1177316.1 putative toxin-antitoxin system toxin component, PIN family [Paludibacteraceae bacterium]MEE1260495.1 putative toxin-antitoxin system toxin component, PIN family [Paludibacteraceae bacterium]
MDRIVLDTNCLIMAISARTKYNQIWKSFLSGDFVLCLSNEILEEYEEVIARNVNPKIAGIVIYTILTRNNVERLDPHFHFHLIQQDEDDNKFVDCAIVSNAKCIVSEDRHFEILKTIDFPKVDILGIDEFVNTLL